MSDLLKWKDGACEAAKIASNLLLSMRQNFSVREKGLYDLVTDADTASQKVIYEHLKNSSQIMISLAKKMVRARKIQAPTHRLLGL